MIKVVLSIIFPRGHYKIGQEWLYFLTNTINFRAVPTITELDKEDLP